MSSPQPVTVTAIAPGAFLLPGFLSPDTQRALVDQCRALIDGSVPALAPAQELGPKVKRIRDWIHVYAAKDQDSNVTIIDTPEEGVVLIDTGQTTDDARAAMNVVRKLTTKPVRFVIHSEADTGIWLPDQR